MYFHDSNGCKNVMHVKLLDNAHSFLVQAKEQFEVMNNMYKKMTSLYEDMSKYYCFDKKKYGMEDFFGDIKIFQDSFKVKLYTCVANLQFVKSFCSLCSSLFRQNQLIINYRKSFSRQKSNEWNNLRIKEKISDFWGKSR